MKQRVLGLVCMMTLLIAMSAWHSRALPNFAVASSTRRVRVLPGVTVVVKNQETGMVRETVSGADGSFIASGLVPGTYQVNAELQGFKKFERKDLRLEVGKTSSIDVTMAGRRRLKKP